MQSETVKTLKSYYRERRNSEKRARPVKPYQKGKSQSATH